MRAFWTAGYEATSTQELCAATGLGRSSIYNTFASKHELFVKALSHYMDVRTTRLIELLKDDAKPIRERLRTVLEWAVAPDEDDPSGCLVVNATVELDRTTPTSPSGSDGTGAGGSPPSRPRSSAPSRRARSTPSRTRTRWRTS